MSRIQCLVTHWFWFTWPLSLVLMWHPLPWPPTQWLLLQLYLPTFLRSVHFSLSPLLLSQFSLHYFSPIRLQYPLIDLPGIHLAFFHSRMTFSKQKPDNDVPKPCLSSLLNLHLCPSHTEHVTTFSIQQCFLNFTHDSSLPITVMSPSWVPSLCPMPSPEYEYLEPPLPNS